MTALHCPGQDRRFWKPTDIYQSPCPHCGRNIEFWKDDVAITCRGCGNKVINPRFDPGCATWCAYAEQCVGEVVRLYSRHPQVLRERLREELERHLPSHPDLLSHSLAAAEAVQDLLSDYPGANAVVVTAACLLQDIGMPHCPDPNDGECHERESADLAAGILEKAGLGADLIDATVRLIAHHHRGGISDPDFLLFRRSNEVAAEKLGH